MDRRTAVEGVFVQHLDEETPVCMRGGPLRQTRVSVAVGSEEWVGCRALRARISVRSVLDPVVAVMIRLRKLRLVVLGWLRRAV